MSVLERLNKRSKQFHITIGIILTITGFLDYWTGFEFRIEIFYLVPISYLTWFVSKKIGITVSVLSIIVILSTDIMAGKNYYNISVEIWNMVMYLAFFVVVTFLINGLRDIINRLQKTLSEVKELQDILPICSNCKKIRDDEGYWHDVAVYITNHTNTKFTHGLCQECAMKLYPEFIKKKNE